MRKLLTIGSITAMVVGLFAVAAPQASATKPDPLHQVTICHRTNSVTHPYVRITVDEASVDGNSGDDNGQGDHLLEHTGPVFDVTGDPNVLYPPPHNGDQWGDIIPPFYSDVNQTPDGYPSLNWNDAGQAIWNNGCKIPNEPVTTFLTVIKHIPNVLEGTESASITFTLSYLENPVNDQDGNLIGGDIVGTVGTCTITFTAGMTQSDPSDCKFNNLTPGAPYELDETDSGGFTPLDPIFFYGGDSTGTTLNLTNSFGPASAQACKVTNVNGTGHDASGDSFTFELLANGSSIDTDSTTAGVQKDTVTVAGGGTVANPNCLPFATVLNDNVNYTIVETSSPTGYSQDSIACDVNGTSVTAADGFTPQYPGDADSLFTCAATDSIQPASAQACKVTVMNGTGHDASNDTFTFALKANGTEVETVDVKGGGTAAKPNCKPFTTVLQDGVTYTITEKSSPTGYSQDSMVCDSASYTPSYPGASSHTYTCTATDSIQPADATVQKVTNPTGHLSGWTFRLFVGTTQVAVGTTGANGKVDFGYTLQDGVTYTIKEDSQTWWRSNGGVGDCTFTVHYPADSGRTYLCTFTNTEFTNGLTLGYWKNHLAKTGTTLCPSKLPNGTSCSASGPFTSTGLPTTIGGMSIAQTQAGVLLAANVFANNDCGGSTGKSAINCLAAQLLAARLNIANSANPCINQVISDSNSFLNGGTVDGVAGVVYTVTPYAGTTISNNQKNEAVKLKTYLDTYNNGTCPI